MFFLALPMYCKQEDWLSFLRKDAGAGYRKCFPFLYPFLALPSYFQRMQRYLIFSRREGGCKLSLQSGLKWEVMLVSIMLIWVSKGQVIHNGQGMSTTLSEYNNFLQHPDPLSEVHSHLLSSILYASTLCMLTFLSAVCLQYSLTIDQLRTNASFIV